MSEFKYSNPKLEILFNHRFFPETVVIVLTDADLDAVVNFLTSITNDPCVWKITTVYIQESIENNFSLLYKKKVTKYSMEIISILKLFRFKEELTSKISHTDAISIWTENVTAAKSFVMNMMVLKLIFLVNRTIFFFKVHFI